VPSASEVTTVCRL